MNATLESVAQPIFWICIYMNDTNDVGATKYVEVCSANAFFYFILNVGNHFGVRLGNESEARAPKRP